MVTRPNYIAAKAWGVRPKSPIRRSHAVRAGFHLITIFLVIAALFVSVYVLILKRFPIYGGDDYYFWLYFTGWWAGAFVCAIAPFTMSGVYANERVLWSNFHDYYLAGFTGEEMIRGMAAPQLRGVALFGVFYPLFMLIWLLFMSQWIRNMGRFYLLFFLLIPSLFNLFQGALLSLSLWTRNLRRETRSLALLMAILASPSTICVLAAPFVMFLNYRYSIVLNVDLVFVVPLELMSMLARCIVIDALWDTALDRLEMRADPWREPPRQIEEPPSTSLET